MPRTFFDELAAGDRQFPPPAQGRPLLILGASTRSAAHSAIRAGFAPVCGDMFADLDLRACSRVLDLADYPHGLIAAAAAAPDMPWIYTGGLENHPELVRTISRSRPLWGNGADVLTTIRDPWLVAEALTAAGLPVLRVWRRAAPPPPADGTWMHKPLHGAAGLGIAIWDHRAPHGRAQHEFHYFQERRAGIPISALCLALPGQTILLGITRQLVGLTAGQAPEFAWCGTITPVSVSPETRASILQTAERLAPCAGLRGLFGCDFLCDKGVPWLTEVNPRYPGSTELIEHQLGLPLLDWHRRACESFVSPPSGSFVTETRATGITDSLRHVVGKIILYAKCDLTAPDLSRFIVRPASWMTDAVIRKDRLPYVADVPVAGTRIATSQPICTLFARARSENECLMKLERRAARFEARLT